MKERNYSAVNTMLQFDPALINRCLAFMERCGLTSLTQLYIEVVNDMVFDQIGVALVESELGEPRPETWELKSLVEKTFAPIAHLVCSC